MDHSHGNDMDALKSIIPDEEQCERVAACFSKLGDGTRLKIFCLLCHSEQCVMGIASLIGMSSPAVAHHLRLLKDAELISSKRKGKEMYYSLADNAQAAEIHKAVDTIFDLACLKS